MQREEVSTGDAAKQKEAKDALERLRIFLNSSEDEEVREQELTRAMEYLSRIVKESDEDELGPVMHFIRLLRSFCET
jgi:hypothetical protein